MNCVYIHFKNRTLKIYRNEIVMNAIKTLSKIKVIINILIISCSFSSVVLGQNSIIDELNINRKSSLNFSSSLSAKYLYSMNTINIATQKQQLNLKSKVKVELSNTTQIKFLGKFTVDSFDKLEPRVPQQLEVSDLSKRTFIGNKAELELRELFLETSIGRTYVTIGKQQIVWGKADGLKVLDLVNPQYFREYILEEFEESRIPLWSVNVEVPISELVLQLIWIPDNTYNVIPENGSLFAITSPILIPQAPEDIPVKVKQLNKPGRFFKDSDFGLRVSTFLSGWDLTLNYLYHFYDNPVLYRNISVTNNIPQISITPQYERSHIIGGTFSKAMGSLTLRGEVGYSINRYFSTNDVSDMDGIINSNTLDYVLGFDWFGIEDGVLSFQFFQSWLANYQTGIFRKEFENNFSLLARRNFLNETLEYEILYVINANRGDGLLRLKTNYDYNDNIELQVGYDLFHGNSDGLFGQFGNNDRVYFSVEYSL